MKRFIAIVGLLASLVFPSAVFADGNPGDSCASAQTGNWQMIEYRTAQNAIPGAHWMDDVQAQANIIDLWTCNTYVSSKATGSFVLPANVQASSGSGLIAQLGYGKKASNDSNHFYYALSTSGAAVQISSPLPRLGDTYRFRIYRRSSGYVSFEIYDVSTSAFVWTYYPTTTWPSYWNMDWWGYELLDKNSTMGSTYGIQNGAQMTKMGYSADTSTTEWYRSNVTCNGTDSEFYVHKNYTWDNQWVDACDHGTGTFAYVYDDTAGYGVFSAFDRR